MLKYKNLFVDQNEKYLFKNAAFKSLSIYCQKIVLALHPI